MFRALRYRGQDPLESNEDEEEQVLLDEDDDEEEEEEHDSSCVTLQSIPWKGILLAVVLTFVGVFMISVYVCSVLGVITFQPANSITFLILAFISLIPGVYHCVIAFRAFRGDEGYSLDDIADLN